jgi:hypothetical protein
MHHHQQARCCTAGNALQKWNFNPAAFFFTSSLHHSSKALKANRQQPQETADLAAH